MFVAKLYLHPVQLHGRHFNLHSHIRKFRLVIDTKLLQFITSHLFFIEQFFILRFRTLQIELQNRCSHIHTVTTTTIDFNNTAIDGRRDNLFESRCHLPRCTDTDFNRSLINDREYNVFFLHSRTHQGNQNTDNHNNRDSNS